LKNKINFIHYIIWPSLIFLVNNICSIFTINIKHKNFKDLFIQLITGKRIYEVFWFQCNLILSFILLSIISLSIKNDFLLIEQLLGIVGYFYHSLHHYCKLFNKYLYEIRSLFQDFGKVLFYSSIGITLATLVDINNLKKKRKKAILFSLIPIYLIKDFEVIKNKFFYLRCIINGIESVSFFILFSAIPIPNNKKIISIIQIITNYTGGVYYLHFILWKILRTKIQIFNKKTLFGCFLNYILCYFICFVGDKTLVNSNLKYLFI
jgi:hypothetical protein